MVSGRDWQQTVDALKAGEHIKGVECFTDEFGRDYLKLYVINRDGSKTHSEPMYQPRVFS
jgi:hypothetical protein